MNCPIFISYSRMDISIVHPLIKEIEAQTGCKCWIDLNGIESGDQFETRIIKAIENAEIILFMLSDNAMNSDYAKLEVNYAQNCGKKVVPVVIDGGKLRGWFLFKFGGIDFIDYSVDSQKKKLIANLKSWLNVPEPSPDFITDDKDADKSAKEKNVAAQKPERNAFDVARYAALLNKKTILVTLLIVVAAIAGIYIFSGNRSKGQISSEQLSPEQLSPEQLYYKATELDSVGSSTEAFELYKKAADLGHVRSQFVVGVYYEDGNGVKKSKAEAVKWYRKAADQGYAEAQFSLGLCYEEGDGVPQSLDDALILYKKAAKQGYKNAIDALIRLRSEGKYNE